MSQPQVLVPGSVLGMLGGGQLGRMFALAARRSGGAEGIEIGRAHV